MYYFFTSFGIGEDVSKKLSILKQEHAIQDQQPLLILFMLLFCSILNNIMIYLCQQPGSLLDYYVERELAIATMNKEYKLRYVFPFGR